MSENSTKTATQATVPVHDVRTLTGQDGRTQLMLDGEFYTLRIKRTGKLILKK
jgi:hemin uptake protein HemP